MKAKLYVEGAGQTDLERSQCREAFSAFFAAAGLEGKRPRVVPSGGRKQAFDAFVTAMAARRRDELPLLLVDSEAPVTAGQTVWQHLKQRDGWDRPASANDEQAFLMVQVMETWFVADRELLKKYFGPDLREKHLPAWPALEAVAKESIFTALEMATAGCGKKTYAKGKRSFELLGKLNPQVVKVECPSARRLFDELGKL